MNNVYIEMCRLSPVQKEWKPKDCDRYARGSDNHIFSIHYYEKYIYQNVRFRVKNTFLKEHVWLPRQEDWQDILYKNRSVKYRHFPTDFCVFSEIVDDDIDVKLPEMFEMSDYMTMLWCLFVHKEVYGLVWDWEDKKWK